MSDGDVFDPDFTHPYPDTALEVKLPRAEIDAILCDTLEVMARPQMFDFVNAVIRVKRWANTPVIRRGVSDAIKEHTRHCRSAYWPELRRWFAVPEIGHGNRHWYMNIDREHVDIDAFTLVVQMHREKANNHVREADLLEAELRRLILGESRLD